ncbi:MAG: aldo/keto reductase [Planctomycetota bacterium]
MKRRDFVKATVAGAAATALTTASAAEAPARPAMPTRPYGSDGARVSIIGFPGLLLNKVGQEEANRLVADAFERGVTYFDVAPAYGRAEMRMGPALEAYREKVFLSCKTKRRDREGCKAEFERSVERLRTDRFDLYQLHCLTNEKQVEQAFAEDGAMAYILEQQKAGRIRYVGFSAHTEASALAALDRFAFDSVMFPVAYASWFKAGWGPKVVAKAKQRGSAIIAIKGLCRQRWPRGDKRRKKHRIWYEPIEDRDEARLALNWNLSVGCAASIPPSSPLTLPLALDVAPTTRPATAEETAALKARAQHLNPLFPRG